MATALARLILKCSALLVPAEERGDWRREWLAEIDAVEAAGSLSPLGFALGAPWHALTLRANGWGPPVLAADVRYGWRWLRRQPLFALTALTTLAVGVGAVTATFGIVYGILLKPMPYREPSRLVQLWEVNPLFNWTEATIAPGNAVDWKERNRVFEDLAWYQGSASRQAGPYDLTLGADPPEHVRGLAVSANFFDVLGSAAALGRTFVHGEDEPGRQHVVVLTDAFWRSRFGADARVVGSAIRLNNVPFVVIGVMPAAFRFDQASTDLWLPLAARLADLRQIRRPHFLRAIARLKPGVTIAQARQDLSRIASDLSREHPDTNHLMQVGLGPLDTWFVGQIQRPLTVLFLAIMLVLVIACANVANLLLARASERGREIAVRAALGASRSRLVQQLLTESLLLAVGGTGLGLAFADLMLRAFVALAPSGIPRVADIGVQPAVAAFAAGLAVVTTLAVGVAPAWHAARSNVRAGLGDGVRTTSTGIHRFRLALVACEVALAAVLLVGALLALRSFRALVDVDAGFPVNGLVTAKVSLPARRYGASGQAAAFYDALTAKLRAEPGVSAAGATLELPLGGSAWTGDLYIEGRPQFHGRELRHQAVTAGYLEALGVPLVEGRTIGIEDRADTPLVVVVNHAFARQYFPSGGALGAHVSFDDPSPTQKWVTVVGVVGDEAQDDLATPAVPEAFAPETQDEEATMNVAVRSARPTPDVLTLIRRDLHAVDPELAVASAGPFADRLSRSVTPERAAAAAIGFFAICALLLAMIGVYGVAAGAIAGRLREIGIRLAFGATGPDILRLLVRHEFAAVVGGLVVGGLLAAAAGRLVGSMFYGVTGHDLPSFLGGAVILFLTGAIACVVPARRAIRLDPAQTLRQ